MMAAALENDGATVYIMGRGLDVLRAAAQEISVFHPFQILQGRAWRVSGRKL
jgi:NADP-dependent 3-hydroxy acid dehydrogenase YdfG